MQENILIVQQFFHSYSMLLGNGKNKIRNNGKEFCSFDDYIIIIIIIIIKASFIEREQVIFTKNKEIL